jgi:hypothetical protein
MGLENKMKWISVEDRLPEDSTSMLCRVQLLQAHPTIVHFEAHYQPDSDYGGWYDWCGDTDELDGWRVTHWMELPELPEKEL